MRGSIKKQLINKNSNFQTEKYKFKIKTWRLEKEISRKIKIKSQQIKIKLFPSMKQMLEVMKLIRGQIKQ